MRPVVKPLSAERARELLDYNPETGELRWRERPGQDGWSRQFAGRVAGSLYPDGYRRFTIHPHIYLSHRVAWLITNGEWPPDYIDHINGVKTDNRIANLRSVTKRQNQQNQSLHKTNTSGFRGVSWLPKRRRWQAYININNKMKGLGLYADIEDAKAARLAAERQYGFHENHGRKTA